MGTVSKALQLLEIIAETDGAMGLTQLALAADFDKATTRRLLLELQNNGFISQNDVTRSYDLGPALQRLGRRREARFPLAQLVLPHVKSLAQKTQEMVHVAEFDGKALISIAMQDSTHVNRVSLEVGTKLPLHATASGIALLSAASDGFVDSVLKSHLAEFTAKTTTSPAQLKRTISETRNRGYSISNQSYDEGVNSVAAAIMGPGRKLVGTIAVARPTLRVNPENTRLFGRMVLEAAAQISNALGSPKVVQK